MENISENKRKRGRPSKMLDCGVTRKEFIADLVKRDRASDGKSERSHINFYYTMQGQGVLADENGKHPFDGEFSFIIAVSDSLEIRTYKRVILQELGRLEDEEVTKGVAREICRNKLSTDRAVSYIRLCKIGKQSPGDSFNLAVALEKTINDYNIKHYDVTSDLILRSLNIVYDTFSENISDNTQSKSSRLSCR